MPNLRQSCRAFVALAILAASTAPLVGCATDAAPPMQSSRQPLGGAETLRTYRLGVGDKIKITVFGEPDLSGPFEVNALGNVAMPLIGEVPAKGVGIGAFRDALIARLSQGWLKRPKVAVEVANYRPIFVHGEVRNGGEYAYKTGITLRDAVAMAGGYTYRANQSHLLLTREGQSGEASVPLNAGIPVLPGDNIRIPERFF